LKIYNVEESNEEAAARHHRAEIVPAGLHWKRRLGRSRAFADEYMRTQTKSFGSVSAGKSGGGRSLLRTGL